MLPDLTAAALAYLETYGLLALAVFAFAETSMTFPFLPSEVVVPAAALLLVEGPPSLALFVAAATVGATAGCLFAYRVAAGASDDLDGRLERYVRLDADDLETGRRWFREYGQSSVLWGRFLPVLRSVVSVPAGLAGMDARRFVTYSAVGSAAFYGAAAGLVHWGDRHSVFAAAGEVAGDVVGAAAGAPTSAVAVLALFGAVAVAVVGPELLADRDD